jgi:ankyrin repeat protein
MHRFMLFVGMGTALLGATACAAAPSLPLAIVAARNAVATVRQLLADGHEPDERDADGLTSLMWAARSGAVDAMAALLDGGADPNARDRRHGWTPLLHALHRRQIDAVRVLLERGADPNARTDALTPLLMAAPDADPAFVTLLLRYGADPHARGSGGATALSQAVSGGALSDIDRPLLGGCRTESVRALRAHDPTLSMPDTIAGHHALWWAKFHGCEEVLNLVGPIGMRTKG